MHKAKITFSDGSILTLTEDEVLMGVGLAEDPKPYPSISSSVRLENSFHDGLIPSILEVPRTWYNTKPQVYCTTFS